MADKGKSRKETNKKKTLRQIEIDIVCVNKWSDEREEVKKKARRETAKDQGVGLKRK